MTTNLTELMNNVFKGTHNLPITSLVKSTYYRLASTFVERGEKTCIRLKTNHAYDEHCMNKLKGEVNQFDGRCIFFFCL
jgi:hypothetical protein